MIITSPYSNTKTNKVYIWGSNNKGQCANDILDEDNKHKDSLE
jgi:alpha-tubulin suppressor-like RCC1 family protein